MRLSLAKSVAVAFALILAGCSQQPVACGTCCPICACIGIPALSLDDGGTPGITLTAVGNSGDWVVDFGQETVGAQATATILLQNDGTAPLQILSVGMPLDAEFAIFLSPGRVVDNCSADAGTLLIPIRFEPFQAGAKGATVVLTTDSGATPTLTLTLTGTGVN